MEENDSNKRSSFISGPENKKIIFQTIFLGAAKVAKKNLVNHI